MVIRVHYNKKTAKDNKPWTVHTSKNCIQASHVYFKFPVETEERPEKKKNPRYFLKCKGRIINHTGSDIVCIVD